MNILLWTFTYPFIGLLVGNIKWKMVFSEHAKSGRWYFNPLFWFFFPWRCLDPVCYVGFSHHSFSKTRQIRDLDSIFTDMDYKPNINRSVTMDTIFWFPLVVYNIGSLILILIGCILFHLIFWTLFPSFKFITKPIRKFFRWVTFDLFRNKQPS